MGIFSKLRSALSSDNTCRECGKKLTKKEQQEGVCKNCAGKKKKAPEGCEFC
jgi:predicted amidophosphoribosyltransferase